MTGLFEDDANVRKPLKPPVKKKQATKRLSVAQKIVAKTDNRSRFVIGGSGISFTEVDISPEARAKKKVEETGKIIPPINYVSDEKIDDEIQDR